MAAQGCANFDRPQKRLKLETSKKNEDGYVSTNSNDFTHGTEEVYRYSLRLLDSSFNILRSAKVLFLCRCNVYVAICSAGNSLKHDMLMQTVEIRGYDQRKGGDLIGFKFLFHTGSR